MVRAFSKPAAFSATCIGASHLKTKTPCQDYSASWASGQTAVAAVADGHGNEAHFRSDRGSRFAVDAAIHCIKEFVAQQKGALSDPSAALTILEKSIIAAWHEKIICDIKANPYNVDIIDGNMIDPYGTTLLAAAITEHYWFAIHIGDGKCVVIDEAYTISQPVPWDDRCFLFETTSLCDEDAIRLFRHYYDETLPLAIFLGSDGVDDSFPINGNEEYLGNFYYSLLMNFADEGLKKGKEELQEVLPLLTEKGSGDDISIAGIIRSTKNEK
jgi:hypothetical protein